MNSNYGCLVDSHRQSQSRLKMSNHEASMAQLLNIHNETFNNKYTNNNRSASNYSLLESATCNPSWIKKQKNRNASLNLTENAGYVSNSNSQQYQELITTLERNYELNKQLKSKYLSQLNGSDTPQATNNHSYQNYNTQTKPVQQSSSSILLPRKKYNQSGYSSDSDCYTKQLDQLSMGRPKINQHHHHHQIKSRHTLRSPLQQYNHTNDQVDFERAQFVRNNQRYRSLERDHSNHSVNQINPLNWQQLNYYSSNQKLDSIPNHHQANSEQMKTPDENENLIESINNYFLKWKTFNYDPVDGSEEPMPTTSATKQRSQSRCSNYNPAQGIHSILTSPEEIYQETDNSKLTFTLPSSRRSKFNCSIDPETILRDDSKEFEGKLDSCLLPMENLFTDSKPRTERTSKVEEIVPLENALSNMNQILKNLAQTAEKKKNEYEIMQSVINDFEALKELSTAPTTSTPTTISIPNSTTLSQENPHMSPSSSSSSSSYATTTSTKTSSACSSQSNSTCSSEFCPDSSLSSELFEAPKTYVIRQSLKDKTQSTGGKQQTSLGKKLKRFLSLNTSAKQRKQELHNSNRKLNC